MTPEATQARRALKACRFGHHECVECAYLDTAHTRWWCRTFADRVQPRNRTDIRHCRFFTVRCVT